MNISSVELWQRIAAEGLASPMQCRTWAAEAAQGMEAADTLDGVKMLQKLIEIGRLSNYQAKILAGQSDRPLRRGAWHILGRVKESLWGDWLEVTQIDLTKANGSPTIWAKWLSPADLESLQSSLPSLTRGMRLAEIRGDHLQTVYMPALVHGELELQVAPIQGKLLSAHVASRPLDVTQANAIIRQIADALVPMHAAGIPHGRVMPDRIYWDGQLATLVRDPISTLTATLQPQSVGVLGEQLGDLSPLQFLAPEFMAPGQLPSLRSDVFALGCTWWWMLTGQPPAEGKNLQAILAAQAKPLPQLSREVQLPEPLERVLKHCLARNIAARFPSASELCIALDKASEVIRIGKIARPVPDCVPSQSDEASTTTTKVKQALAAKTAPVKKNPRAAAVSSSAPTPTADGHSETTSKSDALKSPSKPHGADSVQHKPVASQADRRAPETVSPAPEMVVAQPVQAPQSKSKTVLVESSSEAATNKGVAGQPSVARSNAALPARTRRGQRAKKSNKLMLSVAAGCGFLVIMLLALKFSGALQPSVTKQTSPSPPPAYVPANQDALPEQPEDPRLEHFQIVDSGINGLWAPPALTTPFPLDLLPPGGQFFVSFRPANLLASKAKKSLIGSLETSLPSWLAWVADQSGVPLEKTRQVTLAFFSPAADGSFPQVAMRIQLDAPQTLGSLRLAWAAESVPKSGDRELFVTTDGRAYYVDSQPLLDAQSVTSFSVGPTSLMAEVAEMSGAVTPLVSYVEKLWKVSDLDSDLAILFAPQFLFVDGRGILESAPLRLQGFARDLLGKDMRAGLIQTRLEPSWYYEVQLVGASDRDAGRITASLESQIQELPTKIETWFVAESPHPYWRALAIRFPQMLRTVAEYSRFGVEDGVAVMNAYLPAQASQNVLLSSWIALQDGATLAESLQPNEVPMVETKSLTPDEYLARPIKVIFDQEPIEVALQMIADEANSELPTGSQTMRFALDGDAFEKAGITRNQQLRNFSIEDKSVREALTEVAKRGNPNTTVKQTSDEAQQLIWVVKDDPTSPGSSMISLTTRTAATAGGIVLPREFVGGS